MDKTNYVVIRSGYLCGYSQYFSHVSSFQGTLSFAGEATHPTFYTTTHGAFMSGERAAKQLISHTHESPQCSE